MKFWLAVLLFAAISASSQTADFIVLKKRGKTVQSFFAGQDIAFTSTSGAWISANINGIKNDTLYLQEFVIQRLPTTFGTYILDTAGSYHYKFHYKDIAAFGSKPSRGFNLQGSGASLFSGGVVLTIASGIVFLADRKKFSLPLLVASAGLGAVGYLLMKSGGKPIIIGRKYKLVYMNMGPAKTVYNAAPLQMPAPFQMLLL